MLKTPRHVMALYPITVGIQPCCGGRFYAVPLARRSLASLVEPALSEVEGGDSASPVKSRSCGFLLP